MWFDNEFEKMFGRLSDRFFSWNDNSDNQLIQVSSSGPYYYGYELTVGPDGKPHVQEWGNTRPVTSGYSDTGVRTIVADQLVDKEKNLLKIVTEMPGVEKSDINVTVDKDAVHITADKGERKYRSIVPLRQKIHEDSAKAHYANGILEVTFNLAEEKPQGKIVSVE